MKKERVEVSNTYINNFILKLGDLFKTSFTEEGFITDVTHNQLF